MSITATSPVADLVLEEPSRARVFERYGIDYCCGGRKPLEQACAEHGIEVGAVVAALEEQLVPGPEDVDWTKASLASLIDHIVNVHHRYLREELPQLGALVDKVASRHGDRHPELLDVRATFAELAAELQQHMLKEERVLFPVCEALEEGERPSLPFGSVENPIAAMRHEHDDAAHGLARIRELTDAFTPPSDACTSYRAMLDRLDTFDRDLRRHVHEENNVLFPRTVALELS
ncbi:MAG: iron-sulfur cluster repair di-iron protein [Gaiellales bacterium]